MVKRWCVLALACGCSQDNPGFILGGTRGASGTTEASEPGSTTEPAAGTTTGSTSAGETTGAIAPTSTEAGETTGEPGSTTADTSGSSGDGAVCLDGVVAGDELCDDGNDVPGDGCEANCRPMFREKTLAVAAARHLAAVDLDDDGAVELVVAQDDLGPAQTDVTVLAYAGGGEFVAAAFDDEVYENVAQVVVGQFAGDARPDLVVVNADGPGLRLWVNASEPGVYAFQQQALGLSASVHVGMAATVRLDAAAWDDVVMTSPGKSFLFVVENHGDLDTLPKVVPTELAWPLALAVGSFQAGDEFDDVMAVHAGFEDVSEYRGVGDGVLAKVEGALATCAGEPSGVAAGDADGLGARDDAVVACTDGTVTIYGNDGIGRYLTKIGEGQLGLPTSAGLIDVYGDGEDTDLFVLSAAPTDLRVVVRRAGQDVLAAPIGLTSFASAAAVADLDGDGSQDVAVSEPAIGRVQVFFNQTQLPSP